MNLTKQRIAMMAAAGAVALVVMAMPHGADAADEKVCPDYDTGHLSAGNDLASFTYTAPEGRSIVALCVKAGTEKQGDGPEAFGVDEGATSVTFRHSTGKDISHSSVKLTDKAIVPIPTVPPPPPPPTTTPPRCLEGFFYHAGEGVCYPGSTPVVAPPAPAITGVVVQYDRNCADGFAFNQGYIGGSGERCVPVATVPTPPAEDVVEAKGPPAVSTGMPSVPPTAPTDAQTPPAAPTAPTLPVTGSEAVLLQLAAALSALGAGAFLLKTARR